MDEVTMAKSIEAALMVKVVELYEKIKEHEDAKLIDKAMTIKECIDLIEEEFVKGRETPDGNNVS